MGLLMTMKEANHPCRRYGATAYVLNKVVVDRRSKGAHYGDRIMPLRFRNDDQIRWEKAMARFKAQGLNALNPLFADGQVDSKREAQQMLIA